MLLPLSLRLRRLATKSPLLLLSLLLLSGASVVSAADGDSDVSPLATVAPAPQCKRLSDSDSKFVSALSMLASVGAPSSPSSSSSSSPFARLADASLLAPLDAALPSLSQCVASTDSLELLAAVSAASPGAAAHCLKDATAFTQIDWRTATATGATALFGDVVCPSLAKLTPCVTDVLLPLLETALRGTGGCCDDFLAEIHAAFGAPLQPALTTLLHVTGNALCSQRTSSATSATSATGKPDTCGDSLMHNLLPHWNAAMTTATTTMSDNKAFWSMVNAFQIPNDQACRAARALPFLTTMQTTQEFGSPSVAPYGSCYLPMDALQQYVRALPLWTMVGGMETATVVQTVYGEGQCLKGKDFVAWAMDDNGAVAKMTRAMDKAMGLVTRAPSSPTPAPAPTATTDSPSVAPSPSFPHTPTESPSPSPSPSSTEPPHPSPTATGSGSGSRLTDADAGDDDNDEDSGSGSGDSIDVFDDAKLDDSLYDLSSSPSTEKRQLAQEEEPATIMNVTAIVRSVVWQLSLVEDKMCLHIPNGVQCSFPGELLTVPYPQVATGATEPPTQPPQQPNNNPSATPPANNGGSTPTTGTTNTTTGASSAAVAMRQYGEVSWTAVLAASLTALLVHVV